MDNSLDVAPSRPASRRARRRETWQRTGLVLLCGFALWLVMDAAVLQHNAEVSPHGARRTAALDVLRPIAAVARWLHLDAPVSKLNVTLGRTPGGGFVIPTVPSTTVPRGVSTTTVPLRPTARHPLRVLIIGDSIGEDLAAPLLSDLAATGETVVWTDTHISTGITRPDYFNWVAELQYDMYHYKPQLVIGMMGANDATGFVSPVYLAFNTPAWRAQYLRNAGQLFSAGKSSGGRFIWVSVPVIADKGRNAEFQVVRDLQHKAAFEHRVNYVDSDTVLSPHGTFAAYLRVGGQLALVRQPDGIHLTTAGGDLLAREVMVALRDDLHLRLR